MRLDGVRRQLGEARALFVEVERVARAGELDNAYRAALRARNLVFHATRGLAAARGEDLPEMPIVGGMGKESSPDELAIVISTIDAALTVADDAAEMPDALRPLVAPLVRVLGWLREEVGKAMRSTPKNT